MSFASDLTNTQILNIVSAFDRQMLPLNRRFEGDDEALRLIMQEQGIQPHVANMALVMVPILREAVARGITIPKLNE